MDLSERRKRLQELKQQREDNRSSASTDATTVANASGNSRREKLTALKASRASSVASELQSRVDTWLKNNNNYISNFQKRFSGYTGSYTDPYDSDISDWIETVTAQKNNFDAEAAAIKSTIEDYKDHLDPDWVNSAISNLDRAGKIQSDILSASNAYGEYWSRWDTEDSYNEWVSAMKDRDEKLNFDLSKAAEEIHLLQSDYNAVEHVESEIKKLESQRQTLKLAAAKGSNDARKQLEENDNRIALLTQALDDAYKKYNGKNGLSSLLSEKQAYYTLAERLQSAESLKNNALNAADFETYAAKGAAIENPKVSEVENSIEIFGKRIGGEPEIENVVTYTRGNWQNGMSQKYGKRSYLFMTDEEVKIYNYYLGKGDKDTAQKYLNSLEDTLNQREGGDYFDAVQDNTALEMVFGVAAGLDQFLGGVSSLFDDRDYIPTSSMQYASGMVREDLENTGWKTPEWLGGSSLGQIGYDAVTTTSNMLPSILASTVTNAVLPGAGAAVGAGLLSASAAGSAKAEMLNLGYSKEQANTYGLLVGASEGLLEYALGGISALGGKLTGNVVSKVLGKIDNAFARVAIQIGGGMISEGFEEGLQTVLEPWFKSVVTGADYDAPGIDEVLYSSLLGAITALGFEGIGNTAQAIDTAKTGNRIKSVEGGVERVKDLGKLYTNGNTSSLDSVAYRLANKVETMQSKGKKVGAYTLGRLFIEEGATLSEQNRTDIVNGLVERNMMRSDAEKIAGAYEALLSGAELTDKQKSLLESNTILNGVLIEDIIGENTTAYQRTKGYSELGRMVDDRNNAKKSSEASAAETDHIRDVTKKVENEAVAKSATTTRADGKEVDVKIAEIASVKDGEISVRLEGGEVVKADEVNFENEDVALVYQAAAEMSTRVKGFNEDTVKVLVKGFDPSAGLTAGEYIHGFRDAYEYGSVGVPISSLAKGEFTSKLPEEQRNLAFHFGKAFGNETVQAAQAKINAEKNSSQTSEKAWRRGTVKGEGVNIADIKKAFNDTQNKAYKALVTVAEATGIDIVLYSSETDAAGNYKGAQGKFNWSDDKIYIDINAGLTNINGAQDLANYAMLRTFAHEFTHFIEKHSPEMYDELREVVFGELEAKGENVEELIHAKKRDGMSLDDASREVVAEAMTDILPDSGFVDMLAKKHKSIFDKLRAKLKEFFDNIKAYFKSLGDNPSIEANALKEERDGTVKYLQGIIDAFDKAAVDAVESYQKKGSTNQLLNMDSKESPQLTPEASFDSSATNSIISHPDENVNSKISEDFETAQSDDIRYQEQARENAYEQYDKPVTAEDITILRSIGRKSINEFTSKEIEKAQKWAYKFYQELGVKSPFFRAWFGDWRAKDKGQIKIVSVPTIDISQASLVSGNYVIKDTGWNVYAGKTLNDDTRHHSGGNRINVKSLNAIETILDSAVLLDTIVSEKDTKKKSENTAFLHKLYTIIQYNNRNYIAKTTVEEYYNETIRDVSRRAYNLKAIKIEPVGGQLGENSSSSIPDTSSVISISDLYGFVKSFDKDFSPAPEVSEHVLNQDGTPKVFYHGTDGDFTSFSYGEIGNATGVGILGDGFYFTDKKGLANKYGKNVMPCYLKMSNPYIAYASDAYQLNTDKLAAQGYDGVILKAPNGNVYMVFDNTQIKSATDNIGTFDGENPDIRYQEREGTLTNRKLLKMAAEKIEEQELTEAERGALEIFNKRLSKLEDLQSKRFELGKLWHKQQFGENRDRKAAKQTLNRMHVLDKQIEAANAEVLSIEDKKVLGEVLKKARGIAEAEERARGKERLHKNVEGRHKTEIRNKIKRFKNELESTLLRPTDRRYIPLPLAQAMIDVCDLIDTDTELYKKNGEINKAQAKRDLTKEKLHNLRDEYVALKKHEDPMYSGEYDEQIKDYLDTLQANFKDMSLDKMSLEELEQMYDVLRSIKGTLMDARKKIGENESKDIYEIGDSIIAEQKAISSNRKNGMRSAVQETTDSMLALSLSPVRYIERMCDYNEDSELVKLAHDFEKGERKKNFFKMQAYNSFEALTTGENAKTFEDAIYNEYGGKRYTDVNGRKFGVSKMQMMQAILSKQRETANNMHHVANDGLSFADLKMLRDGKLKESISEAYSHRLPATYDMIDEFAVALAKDKWAQDYMQAARAFFDGMAKDAINETYMTLKHRIIARDKNYIPFEVDKNFVVREINAEDSIQQTINSYGMLKETQDHATQPIIITGLNNIIDRHIEQVATVYGLAIPVRNFNKVWNVRSTTAKSETVVEISADEELAARLKDTSRSKYSIIKDYLVEKFYGHSFTLSDGTEAIMDKRDAQELSHKADDRKTAALSNLRDIIEKASFFEKADNVNHNKFDAFRYYSVKVSFEGQIYEILLNVGRSKYSGEYHIYDITKNKRTANQSSTGLSQPVGDAIKSSSSDNSISQDSDSVNTATKNNSKTPVRAALERNWGVEGIEVITQAVQDLQSPRKNTQSELYRKVKSGYIGATFALNLSVVTKQIGSLYSANAMLLKARRPGAMIRNLIYTMANQKKISAEVDKYSASVWMRRQGVSDAELHTLMTQAKKPGFIKKLNGLPAIINPTKWITAMDSCVALSLWKYAKEDVAASNPNLKGEELLRKTAEFFDSVVENTQSMNDVLHRPEIQKRSDVISESLSMFKTDLYQNAGLLHVAFERYRHSKTEQNKKACVRTTGAILMSSVWGMLMTTAFALSRYKVDPYRDDEEDDELTFESWLKRSGMMFAGDLAGYLMPIAGSEIVGVIENIMYGESDDLVDSLALTAINDLYETVMMVASALKDGEAPSATQWEQLVFKSLQMFGVPLNNIKRTVKAIKLHAEDIANGEFLSFEAGKKKTNARKLYDAVISGKDERIEEVKALFDDQSNINSALKSALRENDSRIKEAARALNDGDVRAFGKYIEEIAGEGNFDGELIEAAIRAEASAFESKIKSAAEAKRDGEDDEYIKIVKELRESYRGVMSQDEIVEAVKGYTFEEETEDDVDEIESIYKNSDINAALESGDTEFASEIISELIEIKTENAFAKAKREAEKSGKRFKEKDARTKAELDARAAIRSSLTSYWKKRYIAAAESNDEAEKNRIRALLHSTRIYAKKLKDLDDILKEWLEE